MTIRYWLKPLPEEVIDVRQESFLGNNKDVDYLNGHQIEDDGSGSKYIEVRTDPTNPASSVPTTIDRKYVKRVTFVGTYYSGFRTDGVYKFKGATAHVVTLHRIHKGTNYEGKAIEKEVYQQISISAGSVRTLREIYSAVREGELEPCENWSISQSALNYNEHQAAAENEPIQVAR